jgi:hypothetical protein
MSTHLVIRIPLTASQEQDLHDAHELGLDLVFPYGQIDLEQICEWYSEWVSEDE